jgi:hypothetical protein
MNSKTRIVLTSNLIKDVTVWEDANPRIVISLEDGEILVYSKAHGFIRHFRSGTPIYEYKVRHRTRDGKYRCHILWGVDEGHAKDEAENCWPMDKITSITKLPRPPVGTVD